MSQYLIFRQKIKVIRQIMNTTMDREIVALQERMPCLNPMYPAGYDDLFLEVKTKIEKEDYSAELNKQIEMLLSFGQTNYTCWVAKKRILQAGNTTIEHEDKFSEEVLLDNLKNFQIWDYRNFIYDATKDHEKQYALMDRILEESPKNYHLWSNRTRIVGVVNNFADQIKRTQKFILKDCYNNSAWTYRAFCFGHLEQKDYSSEIDFTLSLISKHVDNEAAWNYLRGMFPCYKLRGIECEVLKKPYLNYEDYPRVKQFCKEAIESKQISQHGKIQVFITIMIMDSQKQETMPFAREVCRLLAELEPLKSNFYGWLGTCL